MLIEYVQEAMTQAHYKILEDGTYFGEIPKCRGVWANESTLEKCRETLRETLEEWMLLKLKQGKHVPTLGRFRIILPHAMHA